MKRALAELKDVLFDFVDQSELLALVLGSSDAELAYALKVLEAVDQEDEADLFLIFAEPVPPPGGPSYVGALISSLRAQLTALAPLLEHEGRPAVPPLPTICFDEGAPDAARLRRALDHLKAQLPAGDHRLIVALLPLRVDDPAAYGRAAHALMPPPGGEIEPWMSRLRVILRDERASPWLLPWVEQQGIPRVMGYTPDLSAEGAREALAEEVADEAAPMPERMQAAMQLAYLDLGERRYEAAVEKFELLFTYYDPHAARGMQALCLGGIGDAQRGLGHLEPALLRYQEGLALCAPTQDVGVTMNLAFAAGATAGQLGRHEEALGYFDIAERVAAKIDNPYVRADAAYHQGLLHRALGARPEALARLREAAEVAREAEHLLRLKESLERLLELDAAQRLDEGEAWRREHAELAPRIEALLAGQSHDGGAP